MEEIKKTETNANTIDDRKIFAILCYLSIFSIIAYVLKKDDEFIQFHAKQGMVLFLGIFLIYIPVIGGILGLGILTLSIIGAIKAYQGEKYRIPVVADLADKINF